jgi:hypothetical protein
MRSKYFCSLALVLGLFFVSCDGFASNEVQALRRFKEAIYEDPLLVMSNWNDPNSDPCDWTGIYCSPSKDHVIKINISASSIKGFLAPELGQITYLQELILHGNILIGTIPKEIGNLKNLKILDLGNNHLMGPIPAEIGSLSGIMIINLQSNGLTGKLPAELGNLKYLRELHIDRNRLQGSLLVAGASGYQSKVYSSNSSANIAGLCKSLKVADFSYNFFVGNIPKCLENLPRYSIIYAVFWNSLSLQFSLRNALLWSLGRAFKGTACKTRILSIDLLPNALMHNWSKLMEARALLLSTNQLKWWLSTIEHQNLNGF